VIAALLLACLAQAPQRDVRPPTAATGTIAGTVTSTEQPPRPLRRVRVTIIGSGVPLPRTVITGDDGAFTFDRVTEGRFTVSAMKDGYVTMNYGAGRTGRPGTPVTVAANQAVRIALRLPRGAVITGTITDIDGLPASGVPVVAMTYRYGGVLGDRRYMGAGPPAMTDDRGIYRIFALPEGDYVIMAQPFRAQPARVDLRMMSGDSLGSRSLMMAQVYYPGVTSIASATRITVRAGEERSGIDVAMQYVPLATVAGTFSATSGWNPAMLSLAPLDAVPGIESVQRTARADADGRFAFPSVPPGQYRIVARSTPASPVTTSGSQVIEPAGNRQFAFADVVVDGEDVSNVALSPQPGLTISGRIVFEGERAPTALPERIDLPAALTLANTGFAPPAIRVEGSRFTIEGVMPGLYRPVGNLRGLRTPIGAWWLKSVAIAGREILDAPLELRQGADDGVAMFSDRASEVTGRVNDGQGAAAVDAFVVVFSTDRGGWFFNSRRVAGVRVDSQGRYAIFNLPPGDYRIVATTDLEQGEWFDPSTLDRLLADAGSLTVTGVEQQSRDLVIRDRP
jgi:carboxypeptidase family protein